ncbi:hypothetical protein RRG08_028879 [Elysia crispata]|uniref:Uncharacterized protein n=1 Tax=Elysia crispata TaxID=231223 RepID=A0AAE0YZD6_9GAST|nr:hypothetical protein RRG08_028879 [Elysia crispata]
MKTTKERFLSRGPVMSSGRVHQALLDHRPGFLTNEGISEILTLGVCPHPVSQSITRSPRAIPKPQQIRRTDEIMAWARASWHVSGCGEHLKQKLKKKWTAGTRIPFNHPKLMLATTTLWVSLLHITVCPGEVRLLHDEDTVEINPLVSTTAARPLTGTSRDFSAHAGLTPLWYRHA